MHDVHFSDMIEKIMEVFMDDLSICGKMFDDCLENLDRIWVWLLKQSCRTLNLEQLLFLENFEFPYKFESNLRNEASGNSVICLNSASISSVVHRGAPRDGRLIGRGACNQEQEGNRDT